MVTPGPSPTPNPDSERPPAWRRALGALRQATRAWGAAHWGLLLALWLMMSVPFLLRGWGAWSLLAPAGVLAGAAIAGVLLVKLSARGIAPDGPPSLLATWDDPQLGRFERRAGSDDFVGRLPWAGRPIELRLAPGEFTSLPELAAMAADLARQQAPVQAAVDAFLVGHLLATVNGDWRAEGAPVLDAAGFLQALTLQGLTQHGDGSYQMLFNAGDLLGGHWIDLLGTPDGGPIDAGIVG